MVVVRKREKGPLLVAQNIALGTQGPIHGVKIESVLRKKFAFKVRPGMLDETSFIAYIIAQE